MPPQRVVAVTYERLCLFEFACAAEVFGLDRPELGVPWYRFETCSAEPEREVTSGASVRVVASRALSALDSAQTIVVPGWRDVHELPPADLTRRLRRAHERGARILSICSGAFVLAAAGLLDGRRATTHWRHADQLAAMYPRVQVDAAALYVDAGSIVTSAGSAAGLDMLLHVVRKDYGSRVANQVAQRLVVPPQRSGGQAQFVHRPVAADERGRLTQVMDWVRAHPRLPHDLDSLADRAAMSVRTLQRQFKEATGFAPQAWLIHERVTLAKAALEETTLPLARVADQAGFASLESFRRHFRQLVGTSPSSYRASFGRPRGAAP